jgi:hypothetical protein
VSKSPNIDADVHIIVEFLKSHGGRVSTLQLCESFSEELQMDHIFEDRPAVAPTPAMQKRQGDFQTAILRAIFLDLVEPDPDDIGWLRLKTK